LPNRLMRARLRAALNHAGNIGLERVELEVFASNHAAIRLYENLGFEVEGTLRRACKLDGNYDDLLRMAVFLNATSSGPELQTDMPS